MAKYSFLCPNGTIFNQEYFICDWWFNVNCDRAESLSVSRNDFLAAARSEADARLDSAASDVAEVAVEYQESVRRERESPYKQEVEDEDEDEVGPSAYEVILEAAREAEEEQKAEKASPENPFI